ncbi:MAG: insulinase family protein [candidate division Zixibacteria bacterium]|nr:insulinase family protein [candidate division Zixibacteria bacterium]
MKRNIVLLTVLVSLLAFMAPASQSGTIEDLEFPKLNKLEIPDVDRITLDNGMRLYLVEDNRLPIFRMSVRINGGAYLEPADKVGLIEILGEVLRTGGTAKWTGDELDELLEGIGGSVETFGGTTSCGAYVNVLSEYSDLGLEVLADILRNPVFDQDKIELSKVGHNSAISRRNDDPMRLARREFRKLIYGAESPYARHSEYATIEAIGRDDLVAFHSAFFKPENVQMAIWGDYNKDKLLSKIETLFGDWETGGTPVPPPPEITHTPEQKVFYVDKTDVNQSQVMLGHIGGKMTDPDYADRIIMNTIMGVGFGSRMVNIVRSKEGLAYSTVSTYGANLGRRGIFYNYAATRSESTGKAILLMIDVIKSMQTEPPTKSELAQGKDSYLNSFVFNFDTRSEIVNRMMQYDFYGVPEDFLQKIKERVEELKAEDIIAAAQKYLHPDSLVFFVVGKTDDYDIPLDSLGLGPVEEIDVTIPSGEPQSEIVVTPESLERGSSLLAQAIAAHGGLEAYQNITSVISKGTLTVSIGGQEMPLQMEMTRVLPDKSRSVISFMGNQIFSINNGVSGWKTQGMGGPIVAKTEEDLASDTEENRRKILMIFRQAGEGSFQAVYGGPDQIDGIDVETLTLLDPAGGTICRLAIDANTHRLIQESYWGETPTGEGNLTERFVEWTTVEGVELPTRIETSMNGQVVTTAVMSEIQINQEVPEGTFDKPE